jgi:hypothetical protein
LENTPLLPGWFYQLVPFVKEYEREEEKKGNCVRKRKKDER